MLAQLKQQNCMHEFPRITYCSDVQGTHAHSFARGAWDTWSVGLGYTCSPLVSLMAGWSLQVLFDELHLDDKCSRRLSKTQVLHQKSTSEAVV